MVIGGPTFNQLGTNLSTLYYCMKYPLFNEWVEVIQGYQEISRKCYVESRKLKKSKTLSVNTKDMGQRVKPPEVAPKGEKDPPQEGEEIEEWSLNERTPGAFSLYNCLFFVAIIFYLCEYYISFDCKDKLFFEEAFFSPCHMKGQKFF